MKMKAAILQTKVFAEKEKNIRQLEEILASGRTEGADLVTLPEMFACPYETVNFPLYAEPEGGPTWQALSALAKKYGIYLSAGSIPELETTYPGNIPEHETASPGNIAEHETASPGNIPAYETDSPGNILEYETAFPRSIPEQQTASPGDIAEERKKRTNQQAAGGVVPKSVSTPERSGKPASRVYNTAYVFDRFGRQIGKHRKAHLFDINVSGGQSFKESDTLTPGNTIGCFDTEFGKMGLCICYDFRFPETARLMAQDGAKVILVPAAFNMTTGPAHWELMFRQRAVESQCYVIGTAPARDTSGSYVSWGHSIVVDPWGTVIAGMDEKEGILVVELDFDYLEKVRRELPLLEHRRTDLYELHRK